MAYAEKSFTEVVGAGGTATVNIRVDGQINTWTLTQITAELPEAPSGSTCAIRKNGSLVTLMIPQGSTAAGDPPVLLRPSDLVTVTWAGCTPGTVAKVFVFYDDGRP